MSKKIRRNQICPCGSGRKYKKCCGNLNSQSSKYPYRIQRLIDELDNFFLGKANLNTFRFLSSNYGIYYIKSSGDFFCDESVGLFDITNELYWDNNTEIDITEEQRIISLFFMLIDIINLDSNQIDKYGNKFSDWLENGKVKLYRGIRKEWTPECFDLKEGENKMFSLLPEFAIRYTGSFLSSFIVTGEEDENGNLIYKMPPKSEVSESFFRQAFGLSHDEMVEQLSRGINPEEKGIYKNLQNGWLLEANVDVKNIKFYSPHLETETLVTGSVNCDVNEVIEGEIINHPMAG